MDGFKYIRFFSELDNNDVPLPGGNNASLGEMYRTLSGQSVRVPNGFAATAIPDGDIARPDTEAMINPGNPDTVINTTRHVVEVETRLKSCGSS